MSDTFLKVMSLLIFFSVTLFTQQLRLTTHRAFFAGGGGGKIYFIKHESGETWDMYRMNEDGTNIIRLTNDDLIEFGGEPFPDGTKIALSKISETHDYIYIMNIDGTSPRSIYSTTENIVTLKVSTDGSKIAFVQATPLESVLYIINADGTGQKKLSDAFHDPFPGPERQRISFSPNEPQICFINKDGLLSKINFDGTESVEITTFTVSNPYWLKTNKIVFCVEEHTIDFPNGVFSLGSVNPDGSEYSIIYSTTSRFYDFAVSPDETKFAISVGNVIVVVSTEGAVLSEIDIPQIMWTPSWISDTKLVFSNMKDIFTVNFDGIGFKNITKNDLEPFWVGTGRGNKILYFPSTFEISHARKFYTMNTDGTDKMLLMELTETQKLSWYWPELSPDGSKLLYSLFDGTRYYLYVRNTDGTGTPIKIDENSLDFFNLKWSPLGTKIIYSYFSEEEYIQKSFISNPDGKEKKPILPEGSSGHGFIFSPDGSKIMFFGSIGEDRGIYVTPVSISSYKCILSTDTPYIPLDWKSNKVLLLTMVYQPEYKTFLYTMNPDGTELKSIDEYRWIAKLSPDGLKIAYLSTDGKLYVINSDGTGKVKLSDVGWEMSGIEWSLDGKKIVYSYMPRFRRDVLPCKVYIANADGSNPYNLNPQVKFWGIPMGFVKDNKVVYLGNFDIWVGGYEPYIVVPPETVVPVEKGEVKVVVPEGGGERGTINPDLGRPVNIWFKGEKAGKYTLRIFTQLGEEVYTDTKETTTPEGWFEWLPKDLASGVYFVYVEGPGLKIAKKIPILR